MKTRLIDISVPIRNKMAHWPGDSPPRIRKRSDMETGDSHTVSVVSMGLHAGTHIDSPSHFIRDGKHIDEMPVEATVGPARVVGISDPEAIKPDELKRHRIQRGERILFKTRNSDHCWKAEGFVKDFVYISNEGARYLVGRGVQTIGIDYLSVGSFKKDGAETHRILLKAGIWLIEGLDLSRIRPRKYNLICLPLLFSGAEAAPARAILRLSRP
jgi:arylformamidase